MFKNALTHSIEKPSILSLNITKEPEESDMSQTRKTELNILISVKPDKGDGKLSKAAQVESADPKLLAEVAKAVDKVLQTQYQNVYNSKLQVQGSEAKFSLSKK